MLNIDHTQPGLGSIDAEAESESLNHYLRLAAMGRGPNASTGESICRHIAADLRALSWHLSNLDPQAREGAVLMLRILSHPDTREMGLDVLQKSVPSRTKTRRA